MLRVLFSSLRRALAFILSPHYPRRFPDHTTVLELRQPLLVVAFLLNLIWYLAAPGDVTAVGLASLGGVLLSAGLWAGIMARGVNGVRQLRYAAVQVGDELEELFTLKNTSALPVLWGEVADQSDLPGYTVASVRAVDAHASLQWRTQARCARHGLYTLGPWEVRLGDPFGIFRVRHVYPHTQEILVYPPLAPLPPELVPHSAQVGDQRFLRQPIWAETIAATTIRAYQPGDPLRHIHWPTSARRDALYTKVFAPEAASTIWLIPDFDASVHFSPPLSRFSATGEGYGEGDTETTLMLLTASLANHLLRQRLRVGLAAYTDKPVVVRPQAGVPHLWKILRALAPLRPTGHLPLAHTLAHLQTLIPARDLALILTPSLNPDWATRWHGRAEVFLIDPASFGGVGNAEASAQALARFGLVPKIIHRGDLHPLPGTHGSLRRWEFMTLGTGRVVVKQRPRQV